MSSTMRFNLGSSFANVGGGGGGEEDGDVSAADVARARKFGLRIVNGDEYARAYQSCESYI